MPLISFGTDKAVLKKLAEQEARIRRIEEQIDFILAQPVTKEVLSKLEEALSLIKGIKLPQ